MLHRGFVGIDRGYAERELDADRAANGASNFTREPASGLAPASAYANLVVAHPPADWTAQYQGSGCQSTYPLKDCPFPGLCAPVSEERKMHELDQPCVVWRSGIPASLRRVISSAGHTVDSASREHTLDFDSPGRWLDDDLWHPCASTQSSLRVLVLKDANIDGSDMHHNEGYAFFTPEDVQRCFMGKRIMLTGDSMVRQL